MLKLYALFINGKNGTVICYIAGPYKAGLTELDIAFWLAVVSLSCDVQ